MTVKPSAPSSARPASARPGEVPPARFDSTQLFGDATEVHITHQGTLYRLKQTALRKLILTK